MFRSAGNAQAPLIMSLAGKHDMFTASHRTTKPTGAPRVRPVEGLALAGAVLLFGAVVIVPTPPTASAEQEIVRTGNEQSLELAAASISTIARTAKVAGDRADFASDLSPEAAMRTIGAAHTNRSWAQLVLYFGGWPITEESTTTIMRWMRQENGVDNWWNRNNPLNNGWGTDTGNYMGWYSTLYEAAQNAADAIHSRGGYAGIRDAFANSVSSDASAEAIWYSDWASGHYHYGGHWSTAPVTEVEAPAENWGE